jgi:hypothetical protein
MTDSTAYEQLAQGLIDGLISGAPDQVRALFSGPADIDDPYAGRQIDGGFEHLVRNWGPAKLAKIQSVEMEHLTVAPDGKHAGAEFHLELQKPDGSDQRVDVVAVLELDGTRIAKSRLYYRRARIDGVQHVRNRILDEVVRLDPNTEVLERYQNALHSADTEGMVATFDVEGVFNGHGEHTDLRQGLGMGIYVGHAAMRGALDQMFGLVGEAMGTDKYAIKLEKMNGFTDGRCYVLEFNIIDPGHPTNRVHAGVAVYELGDNGLLKEARIFDEAW